MKILVIGPSWVGDMIMAQSLFKLLRQEHPDARIDVLAPAWSRAILSRMPEVNRAITHPVGHGELGLLRQFGMAGKFLFAGYDWAILLPNSFKSGLIPFLARIPRRTGWLGELRYGLLNDYRVLDKQKYPLMVQRFVALGLPENAELPPIQYPALEVDEDSRKRSLAQLKLDENAQVLGLCPGAEFGPSKRWRSDAYAAVASAKIKQGWQVYLFGSAKDSAVAAEICSYLTEAELDAVTDLTGKTSLEQAIDIMSTASLVVSNDSGLMHLAAAIGVPLCAIFGSTSPDFTPPLSKSVRIAASDLDCSPCFARDCPLKHHDCMRLISADQVLQMGDELLAS